MEEWAAGCRHVKVVEEDYMSRKHEIDSVMERIIINADDDKSVSSVSCDDTQGVGPIFSDNK
jgi:hypothetical protein